MATTTKAPRKPVKASITRVLKAAGLAQSIDGGFFAGNSEGFRQDATHFPGMPGGTNGDVVVISWHYRSQLQAGISRMLMGSEGERQKIAAPAGHSETVETAVKALTDAGFATTVQEGRDGLTVWVMSAGVVEHRARLADRKERAAEIAAELLPAGERIHVHATEYPTHREREVTVPRAEALNLLAELIRAGFLETGKEGPLTLQHIPSTGILSKWTEVVITGA